MSVTPRIQLVAFEDRKPGFIFVAVPDERGRYLRTDACVALVPCPFCKAVKGEPCKSKQGYGGGTHHHRRTAGGRGAKAHDVIEAAPAPQPEGALQIIEPRAL